MPDLKAAIARAKANGPRKVDVHQDHLTGKTVSKRSKTGNPACSAAMSAWKLGRGTPEVHAMLARCRAMAAGRRQAELSRAAGNEARAQHLEHRSKQGLTGKDRLAKARELAEKRKAGRTEAPKADASAARRDRIERFMQSERFQKIRKHFTNKQGVDTAKVASERAKAAAALRERLPHIREARQDKKDEASRRAAWLERHKAAAKRGQKNAELVKDYLRKGGTASYSVYRSSSAPTRIVFNKPGHADLIEGADATGGILIRKGREVVSLTGPQSEMFTRPARLAKAKELAEKRKAGQAPVEKPAPIHRAPNDYEREALTKDRHTFLADQVVARTKTKAQRELTGGDGLIKTKEGYVPTRGGKPVSHYRPMDAAAAYDHMRRNGAGPLINQAESDRIDILTEFRKAGWKPQLPAQAEAPKLPTRTADTMSDAIAMSSPNGRMSKRAKAAATERLRVSLFGKEGLPQPSARQLSPAEADAQHAARLKELKEAKKRIKAGDARYDRLGVTGMANRGRARLERAARAAELRAKRKGKS